LSKDSANAAAASDAIVAAAESPGPRFTVEVVPPMVVVIVETEPGPERV
jgi:hypothetical protein